MQSDEGASPPERRGHHELVDHTSEVTIRLRAPTFGALLQEATVAFGELVPRALRRERTPEWRELRIPGGDRGARLVGWLNEVVYLCEVDQWLPVDVRVAGERDDALRVRARGVALQGPFVLVKAATLHNAVVREAEGALEAEVTLDV